MEIIRTIAELRARLVSETGIAFVPTMGNLHDGHLHLVKIAREHAPCVVVSIFVNPLQFGANEDLASYPRTPEQDCAKLETAGADVVFMPSAEEIYPTPQQITVAPPPVADQLCGASRPGHFRGVATVVLKLFNVVRPTVAVFGKKDFQQLFILREMVRQLNLPITLVGAETMRESDGLAMSSRNAYLNPAQRLEAPRLHRALRQVVQAAQGGQHDFAAIETQTAQYLTQLGWIVDYIAIRSANTLLPPEPREHELIALGAARLGTTRLIDNIGFAL
ncbi:MAG: pantoate--beta-alanine ligase [Methylobacillus sp.]|jgi:pantoate--beta-alanine ligase|nr:pantoate--beta-alanine ligase [Methylobacillus sp.]